MDNGYAPLVSVHMAAYNCADYIEEALDSVLKQVCDFAYEIVIGEDRSTDNTIEILEKYRNDFPDKITILRNEKNLGVTENRIAINAACRGKYIAFLDTDDVWTDNRKMQKQVDFLEENSNMMLCATNFTVVWSDTKEQSDDTGHFSFNDAAFGNPFGLCTVMIRKEALKDDYKQLVRQTPVEDWAMWLSVMRYGNAFILPDNSAIYRIRTGSHYADKGLFERRKRTCDSSMQMFFSPLFDARQKQFIYFGGKDMLLTIFKKCSGDECKKIAQYLDNANPFLNEEERKTLRKALSFSKIIFRMLSRKMLRQAREEWLKAKNAAVR